MWKWASWVIKTGATALLLSFLCIWTTGYIVNSYMESLVKQLGLPLEIQPLELSGVWGTLWGAERPSGREAGEGRPDEPEASPGRESADPSPSADGSRPSVEGIEGSGTNDVGPNSEPSGSPGSETGGEPGSEAGGDSANDPVDGSANDPEPAVPVFGNEAGAGSLTDEQRQSLYALVVSKLDQEQLKLLSDALADGVAPEELKSLDEMLKSALTEDEYAQMMALLQGSPPSDANEPFE